jgi:large subunit ribosomal protein L4
VTSETAVPPASDSTVSAEIAEAVIGERETREVDVFDADGSKAGTVELPGDIFDVQVNVPLIHQVVVAQLAAARQGTASTKNRGEVRGGGRKPYRQKGTGRARQGSTRAPQFAGGGVVHGPTPRSYAQRTPKKMKVAALRGALSDRARNGRVHVVSTLVSGDVPSTKAAVAALARLSERKHVLIVIQRADEVAWKSLRNADRVHLLLPGQLNTYDVLVSDDVVFTRSALDEFLAGPVQGRSVTAVATEDEAAASGPAETEASRTEASQTEASQTEGSDK